MYLHGCGLVVRQELPKLLTRVRFVASSGLQPESPANRIMNIWDKLEKTNIKEKEKFAKIFAELVNDIRSNNYNFSPNTIIDKGEYFIVNEENRQNSFFITIVPKEVYPLFKEMQEKAPNEFIGFSILCGKKQEKDIRATCFGVPCSLLAKSLIKK